MTPIHTKNRTIGLLGGSFNPAHGGHVHISLYTLKSIGFDEVWWLVSPQNPLKSQADMAGYAERLARAEVVAAGHKGIRVLDIESRLGTRYSFQTIAALKRRFPGAQFVWMMGADNLAQFHRWRRWQWILRALPLAVLDRAPYSHRSLRSKAAIRLAKFRAKNHTVSWVGALPQMVFYHMKRNSLSATFLRKTLGSLPFLGHND